MTRKHDFSNLTIADLLDARDAYHRHLTHMSGVVGTAIGRYLIRNKDPDATDRSADLANPAPWKRTLENSEQTPWSMPCVLVFVDEWKTPAELQAHPEEYVPPRLYLPDDRVVPTCVVSAVPEPLPSPPIEDLHFAPQLLGGGYPILAQVQEQSRVGSAACLVTDGISVFALTNRHIAGPEEQTAYTLVHGEPYEIGRSKGPSRGLIPFSTGYPGWSGFRTWLNLDAGLVRINDINEWTSQVFGIGEFGPLVNLDQDSLTLDVLGKNVRAFGAISGALSGKVQALFYRYRSHAGFDYVTDFLIGPDENGEPVQTRHGDSGTLWFFEPESADDKPRPFAMQWGSSNFDYADKSKKSFVLASNLTVVTRELDVRLITDWETGLSETWGKLGHYQIGAKACDVVSDSKLFKLLQANKEAIGLSDDARLKKAFPGSKQTRFIALADVPDLWWKTYRGKEKPGHFADMDEEGNGEYQGRTLKSMYLNDASTLNPTTWHEFYLSLNIEKRYQGSLPFRVKQFYEEMVGFVRAGKVAHYIAAAGTLAHYIGDAAQPLHTSKLHHGSNAAEAGVHAQYETKMIERFRNEIVSELNARLLDQEIVSSFSGGQAAAEATIELALYAASQLSPEEIIRSYNAAGSGRQRNENMWADLGPATLDIMEESVLYLAEIWESAWIEGHGDRIANSKLKAIHKGTLMSLYKNKNFLESNWLEDMAP